MRLLLRAALRVPLCAVLLAGSGQDTNAQTLPESSLAVRLGGEWRTWWLSTDAPPRWSGGHTDLTAAVHWEPVQSGVEIAALELAAAAPAWRLRVVLVRLDPQRLRLALIDSVRDAGTRAAWSIDAAPTDAVLALNAGQFTGAQPWGWIVRGGQEAQPPGTGPLSMALVIDGHGDARLIPVDSITWMRARGEVVEAFQSYPLLLRDGVVPEQLSGAGRGVDVAHRDARLALGELRDGRLLIAMTRFAALGETGGGLPFGPTTPEMAALMGALGCTDAMLLDGGLSAQLVVRDTHGAVREWKGWRRVPLALVALPRTTSILAAP